MFLHPLTPEQYNIPLLPTYLHTHVHTHKRMQTQFSVSPTSPLSTPLSWTVSLQHSRSSRCCSHGCHVFTLMSCHWNRFNGYCSNGKDMASKVSNMSLESQIWHSDKVTAHNLKVYLHNYQCLAFIPLLKKVPFTRYASHVLGAG